MGNNEQDRKLGAMIRAINLQAPEGAELLIPYPNPDFGSSAFLVSWHSEFGLDRKDFGGDTLDEAVEKALGWIREKSEDAVQKAGAVDRKDLPKLEECAKERKDECIKLIHGLLPEALHEALDSLRGIQAHYRELAALEEKLRDKKPVESKILVGRMVNAKQLPDEAFKSILTLFMCDSDESETHDELREFLNEESIRRGYANLAVAYHEMRE